MIVLSLATVISFSRCNKPMSFGEEAGLDSVMITTPVKKVLLISIQGARGAVMKTADIPHIKSLLDHGIYSWDAVCDTFSTDQAGWADLFTGVHADKHKVTGNSYVDLQQDAYPGFPAYFSQSGKKLNVVSFNDAPSLNDTLLSDQHIVSVNLNNDKTVKDSAIGRLAKGNPDMMLLSFQSVNNAGKQSGFTDTSDAYVAAIKKVDQYIGEIVQALHSRKNIAKEQWLIIVTSNHGGKADGTYGGSSFEERNTFVIYSNATFTKKEIKKPLINVDYDGTYPFFYRQNGDDHAAYTDNPAYHFGADQSFTIEFNIRTTYGGGDDHPVISNKNWSSGSNTGWAIYKQDGNLRINYKGADAGRIDMRNGPPVADGQWHHITVTFDRENNISFYLDGKFYISGPSIKGNGSVDAGLPFTVGTDATLNYGYNGPNGSGDNYIAGIRVWKTVLSPEEINNWAFIPVTKDHPEYAALIGYWKANEGAGTSHTLKDSSPTGADLTISNGLQWDQINGVLNPSQLDATQFVPKSVDVPVNILAWMGVKILPDWQLDGNLLILQ